jgi:hypothetical protein
MHLNTLKNSADVELLSSTESECKIEIIDHGSESQKRDQDKLLTHSTRVVPVGFKELV